MEDRLSEVILQRCDALARCTEQDGIILRTFLSPAMDDCLAMVRDWMSASGMSVVTDAAGNLIGSYDGLSPEAPRLLIASHLDTVPNAGKYDGILGVLLGIALVERLAGDRLPFAIDVIGFSDEEGVRFGIPFLGSRSIVGTLNDSHRAVVDANGISLGDALDNFHTANPAAAPVALRAGTVAYLEFHIEQGPVLEKMGVPLAVVDSIAGQSRATITFQSRAAHAGTVPMSMRQDALIAAAEWLISVEISARRTPGLVATTGRIGCEPGATNTIPGKVTCSLDVRSSDDALREKMLQAMLQSATEIAAHRRIQAILKIEADQPTVPLHRSLTLLAEQAMSQANLQPVKITSGAGHDAMMIAPHLPACMIFLRSPGGISHHPEEKVLEQDVSLALRTGMNFLRRFTGWWESGDQICYR